MQLQVTVVSILLIWFVPTFLILNLYTFNNSGMHAWEFGQRLDETRAKQNFIDLRSYVFIIVLLCFQRQKERTNKKNDNRKSLISLLYAFIYLAI